MRLTAIDWLRGLVMVLMTSDHASALFYADRRAADGHFLAAWSEPIVAVPFLHRWLSHLCAPTFVFLAGTSIALSAARRPPGRPGFATDLAKRGALLIGCDLVLISPTLGWSEGFWVLLQVLYAIGAGMIAMAALHRLPGIVCGLLGLVIVGGHEWLARLVTEDDTVAPGLASLLLLDAGVVYPYLLVVYPALPWLGVMLLGYALGCRITATGRIEERLLWGGGAVGIGTWLLVEWADGYGNCGMHRVDGSWLRWLQVSKYPPSLGFVGLELGLMAWILALRRRYEIWRGARLRRAGPLILLGRTALFYYLWHLAVLAALAALSTDAPWRWLPGPLAGGLARVWLIVLVVVAVSLPLCRRFRQAKVARPDSWLRWL